MLSVAALLPASLVLYGHVHSTMCVHHNILLPRSLLAALLPASLIKSVTNCSVTTENYTHSTMCASSYLALSLSCAHHLLNITYYCVLYWFLWKPTFERRLIFGCAFLRFAITPTTVLWGRSLPLVDGCSHTFEFDACFYLMLVAELQSTSK